MNITNRTTSRTFRQVIANEYPNLYLRQGYWPLLQYIIYGTFRDTDDRSKLIITSEMLARMDGKKDVFDKGIYNAAGLLEGFERDVLHGLTWNDWIYTEGKARTLNTYTFPDHIAAAIHDEKRGVNDAEGRVYFVDGKTVTRQSTANVRKELQLEAVNRMAAAKNDDAIKILQYLNTLPVHRFNQLKGNILAAKQYIINAGYSPEVELHQIDVLNAIADQAQPFYQPSRQGKTVRVFGLNESMLQLKKEVRRVLTPDWIELDIASSQLAINGMLWGIDEVNRFLKSGNGFWCDLFQHIGIANTKQNKEPLKDAVYALSYGMTKKRLVSLLSQSFDSATVVKFFTHSVVAAIYNARQRQMRKIRIDGGGYTIYGDWLSLKDYSVRSILAQQAQAVEMKVIYKAFELASKTDEFYIVLMQHDGISVSFRKNKEYWLDRIKKVVNAELLTLNIHTVISE